ncbi:MAG: glutamate--tRNA ligase [Deltaproteobacteria bacterium]|nr:glutamate--tRNA ligase [Deltaproteobacteria bacterium]
MLGDGITMVRVRIAPSPTGDPHVGTAYIALFNYVLAKKHGGQFILRIEDTDLTRSKPEWENMILESLRWTGLTWDEGPDIGGPHGPYRQSERGHIYAQYAQELIDKGQAYRCFCSSERLTQIRQEQLARKERVGYDGHCRQLSAADSAARVAAGEPYVVRLAVPDPTNGSTLIKDEMRGVIEFLNNQIDDQVLLKSDGMPTYHLANVVDDHLMEITHVIRAEEWITSTPKHVLLYQAFGWKLPLFMHMPLLRNQDKSKISKRKNPVSINYYKEAGYLPEAMLNYLALMGWTMPDEREKFSLTEMIENFDFKRLSLGGPVFDIKKLTWLNGLYIREQSPEQLVAQVHDKVFTIEKLAAIAPLILPRIEKLEDFVDATSYFFAGEVSYDEAAQKALIPKGQTSKDAIKTFEAVLEVLDAMPVLVAQPLEAALRELIEKLGLKAKEFFMPLRVAISGRSATPPLFDIMAIIGKERCRSRLRNVIGLLKQTKAA